jgi:hypothetical protein
MDGKQGQDQALNLADFKIDDMLSVPGDHLLAEVVEDHGHETRLAEAFDAIASPVLSRHGAGAIAQGSAPAIPSAPDAAPDAASLAAAPPPSLATPSRRRSTLAALAEWLAVPLRRRVALGACAALLLLAVSAPGIYTRFADRSAEPIAGPPADRIATTSKDEPSTPAPTPPQPQPTPNQAASLPAGPSSALSPIPPPAPLGPEFSARGSQPTEARQAPPPAAAASRAEAPRPTATPEAPEATPVPAPAPAQAPLQRQAAAKARPGEAGGFLVQLAAVKSESEARATFRGLRSKYPALLTREPVIRRKEGGNGVYYAVQLGPFESQEDAAKLCGQLKAAGGSCFPTKN